MLKQQTIESSSILAKELQNRNIKINVLPSSALSELSNAIIRVMGEISSGVKPHDTQFANSLISNSSVGNFITNEEGKKEYLVSAHDTIITEYEEKLTNLVSGYIKFAKVTVKETAKELYEKMSAALDNYKFREPEDFFNITYHSLDEVYNSSIISSEVLSYKEYYNLTIDYMNTGNLTSETLDVNTYLLTGNEEIDNLIKIWISKVTPEIILSYIASDIEPYRLDTPQLLDYNFANYLFYRNLTEKADLNLGLGVTQLRTKGSNNRNAFGFNTYTTLDQYNKNIRNGKLVTANSEYRVTILPGLETTYNITIYEETFKKMAEKELPIECLFGYLANEKDYNVSIDTLEKNKNFYLNTWNNIRSIYGIKLNSTKVDVFKNLLSMNFMNQMQDMSDEEKEIVNGISGYNENVDKLFTEFLKTIEPSAIENVDHICLHLVAGVRYYYSNALYILEKMEQLLKTSEDMTPDEAALYAIADYLVDFFMTQLTVSKM